MRKGKKMKKFLAVLLSVMLMATIFTACTQPGTTPETEKDISEKDTSWEYIEEKKVLVVGLDDTFCPMGFRDQENNLVGFDIDLAKAVGEVLGVSVEFQPIDWKTKDMQLSSKRIDCIWNGMSATPDRQESMSLSNKYLNNKIVVMSTKEDVKVASTADLEAIKFGVQAESAALEAVQAADNFAAMEANMTEYDTYDEAILDMQAGRIDAIVVDEVLGEYKNHTLGGVMFKCEYDFGPDFYAIGFRKGETELVTKVNNAIKTLIDNGKAAEISNNWFGKDLVVFEGYGE